MNTESYGKVYLVGAGPGDPKLITVRGLECIKEADVIIYDYLANEKLLAYAKDKVEKIAVNRKEHSEHLDYDKIFLTMLEKANQGKIVTRLKGGDPFVFGRGGEEAEFLAQNNIPFEVIPGITSAIGASAYAGIPVTHRDYASCLGLITGHRSSSSLQQGERIDWDKIVGLDTLVFYMSLANLNYIKEHLIVAGKDGNTPVAIIRWGTKPSQITITGTLNTIADKVKENNLQPPAIIVVGEVVKLREKLRWFDKRPLFGKKIIVTRTKEQAGVFSELLEKQGAEVIELPTIEVIPYGDYFELDNAFENINKYNWIIFTSVNGVKYFFKRLKEKKKDFRILHNVKICAIGPSTAGEIESKGLIVDYVPEDEYRAEGIIEEFTKMQDIKSLKILIPRALKAREILPDELRNKGAEVNVVPVYETVLPEIDLNNIIKELESGNIDIITFTSSSTVNNFVDVFKKENIEVQNLMKSCKVAAIGPITAETAKNLGIKVDIVPNKYTIPDFTEAIKNYFKETNL